jgi:hypothetical protein
MSADDSTREWVVKHKDGSSVVLPTEDAAKAHWAVRGPDGDDTAEWCRGPASPEVAAVWGDRFFPSTGPEPV